MPIDVQWYDDNQHILLYSLRGKWTPAQLVDAVDVSLDLVKGRELPFAHLVDLRQSDRIPLGVMGIYNDLGRRLRDNEELTIIVGANPLLRMLANTFSRITHQMNFRFVDTMEEALAILEAATEREPL